MTNPISLNDVRAERHRSKLRQIAQIAEQILEDVEAQFEDAQARKLILAALLGEIALRLAAEDRDRLVTTLRSIASKLKRWGPSTPSTK